MIKKIFSHLFFIVVCTFGLQATAPNSTHSLMQLMEDTKAYKTTNTSFHAGNLYEHSVWVAMTIQKWFDEGSQWTKGLTTHDKNIARIAGLLHDIGKAGDQVYTFYTKPTHPEQGQNYILGKKQYTLTNGTIFDFKSLFKNIGISEEEQQIISILVGAHHGFGDLMQALSHINLKKNKHTTNNALKNYLEHLKTCADRANYKKPLTDRIIKLALLVAVADVKGAGPCDCHHGITCGDFKTDKAPLRVYGAPDKFKEFCYESRGKQLHEALFLYIKNQKTK